MSEINIGKPIRPRAAIDISLEKHWSTLQTSLREARVRKLIRDALGGTDGPISGGEGPRGFILTMGRGKGRVLCEVQLGSWQGGTQIQCLISRERKKSEAEPFVSWLSAIIEAKS
jgi:hypothetical protein